VSALDRIGDDFPHGTPAGFDQGCRSGGGCPASRETGQSCKAAKTRAARDSQYRDLIASGAPVEILARPELPEQVPTTPAAPRPAPHAATPKLLQSKPTPEKAATIEHGTATGYRAGCRTDCPGADDGTTCTQAAAADKKRRRENPPAPRRVGRSHGTQSGYQGGCRAHCPGGEDGRTCSEVAAEARRAAADRKKAAQATVTPAPKEPAWPATDTTPTPTPSPAPTSPSATASTTTPPAAPPATPTPAPATPGATFPGAGTPLIERLATSAATKNPAPTPPAAPGPSSTSPTSGTPTENPPRSPQPATPFDEPSELLQMTVLAQFRAAWLDGYRYGKAHS